MSIKNLQSSFIYFSIISVFSLVPLLTDATPVKSQTPEKPVGVIPTKPPTILPNLEPFPAEVISNYSPSTASLLKVGDTGKAVKDIQTYLKQQEFYSGSIDGVYGVETSEAVASFQESRNMIADGMVGPKTWAALLGTASVTAPSPSTSATVGDLSSYLPSQAPLLTTSSRGRAVRDIQAFLRRRGYYSGSINGFYGPETVEAVLEFQEQMNLNEDGVVRPKTWDAMKSDQLELG